MVQRKYALVLGMGVLLCSAAGSAQMQVEPSRSLDAMITAAEKEEVSLAEAMPADKYAFATVKNFGQTVAHIAQANYYYGGAASGLKPPADLEALEKVSDKDAAVKALKDSFAFLHQAAATITAANAFEHVGRAPESTRAVLLAGAVAHSRDHYGQLVVYLRMNGIIPPASRPKAK